MSRMIQARSHRRFPRGVALVTSLVMLTVMTFIGVVAMSTGSLEEKMAGNQRNQEIAFQAAESALREGERFVETTPNLVAQVDDTCTNGLCTTSRQDASYDASASDCASTWIDERWVERSCALNLAVWSTANRHREIVGAIPEAQTKPRYIVEFLSYVPRDLSLTPSMTPPAYDGTGGGPGWQAEWSEMYRVTALATGGTGLSRVMLQSTYKKDLN